MINTEKLRQVLALYKKDHAWYFAKEKQVGGGQAFPCPLKYQCPSFLGHVCQGNGTNR